MNAGGDPTFVLSAVLDSKSPLGAHPFNAELAAARSDDTRVHDTVSFYTRKHLYILETTYPRKVVLSCYAQPSIVPDRATEISPNGLAVESVRMSATPAACKSFCDLSSP